jgi:hypothetical protein
MLHIDNQNGWPLTGRDPQAHALLAVEGLGALIVSFVRRHFNFSAMSLLV